jgi:hypothetical protein
MPSGPFIVDRGADSESAALVESLRRRVQEQQDKLELLQAELDARNAAWHAMVEQRDAAVAQNAQLQAAREEQERRIAAFETRLREMDSGELDKVDLGGRFSSMNLLQHTDIPLEALRASGSLPADKEPAASAATEGTPITPMAGDGAGGSLPNRGSGTTRSSTRSLLDELVKMNTQLTEDINREHERVRAVKDWLARMHGSYRRRES